MHGDPRAVTILPHSSLAVRGPLCASRIPWHPISSYPRQFVIYNRARHPSKGLFRHPYGRSAAADVAPYLVHPDYSDNTSDLVPVLSKPDAARAVHVSITQEPTPRPLGWRMCGQHNHALRCTDSLQPSLRLPCRLVLYLSCLGRSSPNLHWKIKFPIHLPFRAT